MEWILVKDKLPEVGAENILISSGDNIMLGFYGYKSEYDQKDGVGFIDYSSWNSDTGYDYFEDDVKYWGNAPTPPHV